MVLAGEKKIRKKNKKTNKGKGEKKEEEYTKPRTRRERLSYWKSGLMTMAATQENLSGMPMVLFKIKNSSTYGILYYLNWDNPVPNCPNSYAPLYAGRPSIH